MREEVAADSATRIGYRYMTTHQALCDNFVITLE